MPQVTIHLGGRERLEPAISKATPLGALGTEALVDTAKAAGCQDLPAPTLTSRASEEVA